MKCQWHRIVALSVTFLLLVISTGGVTHASKFPKLCFKQQDIVTHLPDPTNPQAFTFVLVGTTTGDLNGTSTTNSRFDFVSLAEGTNLFVDTFGDQIMFRVVERGFFIQHLTDPDPLRPTLINLPSGPFTYEGTVIQATGRYEFLLGRVFVGRGIGAFPAQAQTPAGNGSLYIEACTSQHKEE